LHIEYEWAPKESKTRPALLDALKSSRQKLEGWLKAA